MVNFLKKIFTLKVLSGAFYIVAILLTFRWAILEKFSPEPISAIPQILLAAFGFFTNRKANKVNLELFKDFQRQLENAEVELRRFNPKSVLTQLISLEKSIGNSTLPKKYINRLYAELFYLKGKSNSDLGLNSEVYPHFITAFNYQKGDTKLIERACTSYYFTGEKEKAKKIADKILRVRIHNARAWAVKVADIKNLNLLDIPVPVRVSKTFKNILATVYAKQGRYAEINVLLREELDGLNLPAQIEYEDLPYWMLVCSVLYNNELKEFPNGMLNRKDDLAGKSYRIKGCFVLSNSILKLIEGSQLYNENKYYRQSDLIYNHSRYLIDNDSQAVINMYRQFKKMPKSEDNFTIMAHLIPCLSQIKEYDKVIELCEANPHPQFANTQIIAFSHFLKGDFERSCEYFLGYIKEVNRISEDAASNLTMALNVLNRYSNFDTRKIYEEFLLNKVYERFEYKNILKAIALQFYFDSQNNSDISELLNFDLNTFDTLSENLKDSVCNTLTFIGQFEKSDQYLLRYINESRELQSLYLHIKNLINLRSNHIRLLDLLEKWRKHFSPIKEFLSYELEILNQLSMYSQIEVVAEFALKNFPDDPSITTILILALDREDKQEKLKQVLNQRLLKIPFHWQHAFLIGSICFELGEGQLGLDLIYSYAKNNPDNATIRQAYFGLVTMQANKYKVKKYEAVENDTTVRVIYNGEAKIIHINESTLASNEIAKAILGRKSSDTVKIKKAFSNETSVTINDILDKYTGLVAEISEEVANSFKVSGYQMKSISWKSNDIEELNRVFIKEFGADSELKKLTFEDAFNSYYDGKISFTELVRKTDQHKIFEIYETVTRNNSKGFIIPPQIIFRNVNLSEITEYVIDFSVLPILSKWKNVPSQRNYRFIVSQHIKDFIKDKIIEIRLLDDNPLTLIISLHGVQPIPYPPNYKSIFIAELEAMLDWIDTNCTVGFAPEKLDILLKQPDLLEKNDWYFKYLIDTTFLANKPNSVLITDDLIYYKLFANLAKPLTLEHFIKTKEPSVTATFMKCFLTNNYIGLTLSQSDLRQSFDESPILEGSSIFQKSIKNLPFNWHKNENLIFEIIDLAKYIYTHELNLDYKLRLIEVLFVETLKGYPIKPTSSKDFQKKIHEAFDLLGAAEMKILLALTNALKILNYK